MHQIKSPRPADGLTAAQQVTLRETGMLVSHRQAVQYLRDETRLKALAVEAAQLHRVLPSSISDTSKPASRFEQRLTDFGVLDPQHDEPDTETLSDDIERVMRLSPATRMSTRLWRTGLRIGIAALLVAGAAALVATQAHAQAADTLGVHTVSWHDRDGYNNTNPGLMYRHGATGLTVGAYCNSESRSARFPTAPRCRLSTYAGMHWDWTLRPGLTVGATAGVLTGYSRASAIPFVIPSVRIGDHVRVLYAPAADPKGATVVSLVLETEF